MAVGINPLAYNSLWQLRSDAWSSLEESSAQLFMTTIGTSRSSVAYLIEVLVTIARDLDAQISDASPVGREAHQRAVLRLTAPSAPLPDFSGFHPAFTGDDQSTPEGDVRRAFYQIGRAHV